MNVLPFSVRVRIASLLFEGNSLASTARLVGVQPNTVMRFGLTLGDACEKFHRANVRDVDAHTLELDEIWGFVQKKQKRVREDDPSEYGDAYTFVALDADTKLVVSFLTDKRTGDAATRFMLDLRERVIGRPQITTDGFDPYRAAIETAFGADVQYAILVKDYETDSILRDAAHRYSPGRVIGSETRVITGHPIDERISTSYVERSNLSTRMQVRRMTRLTNAFSKRLPSLRAALALHFTAYNFVRTHSTLRTTPAAEAGLTRGPWSMAELVGAVLDDGSDIDPDPAPIRSPSIAHALAGLRVSHGGRT